MKIRIWILIGLLTAGLGCARRQAVVKDAFLLDAPRGGGRQAVSKGVLAVQAFSIGSAYQGKGLVYRTGDNRYESDYYSEYFVSPTLMMTEQTRNWLAASGVFTQVLLPVSAVEPTHILEGHIKQIAADLRDDSNPRAVLEISFFLLERHKREQTIRLSKTYSAMRPLESNTAASCIDALNQCLSEILGDLEEDLASNL